MEIGQNVAPLCSTSCVGRALQPTLVTSKKKKKKEKKRGNVKKNKARMWRPMSRGCPVRANGIALEGWVEM